MSGNSTYEVGTAVKWNEGDSETAGTIAEVYTETTSQEIAGVLVTEKASSDNPAYLISMSGNQRTIKSHGELKPAE